MVYMLWGLIAYPLHVSAAGHGIVYMNQITTTTLVAMLYVTATCGALFFSGFRTLVLLGWLNFIGLLIVMLVKRYEFTSLWCAYAAVVSVIIYFFFRQSRPDRPAKYALGSGRMNSRALNNLEMVQPLTLCWWIFAVRGGPGRRLCRRPVPHQ